jgi:hypothetical protein
MAVTPQCIIERSFRGVQREPYLFSRTPEELKHSYKKLCPTVLLAMSGDPSKGPQQGLSQGRTGPQVAVATAVWGGKGCYGRRGGQIDGGLWEGPALGR